MSVIRYHISPKTGNPNQCHAKKALLKLEEHKKEQKELEMKESVREIAARMRESDDAPLGSLSSVSRTSQLSFLSPPEKDQGPERQEGDLKNDKK